MRGPGSSFLTGKTIDTSPGRALSGGTVMTSPPPSKLSQRQQIYPPQFAEALMEVWRSMEDASGLPGIGCLTTILDTLYQASFLREEGLPVRCRVIMADPGDWKQGEGPPAGFHVLAFAEPRPFNVQEIRKLAPAVSYYRALLAVHYNRSTGTHIWGVVESGARWVNRVDGGRFLGAPLPPHLVVHVLGPGRLLTGCGYQRLLELEGGRIQETGFDPFKSKWLPARFRPVRDWLQQRLVDAHVDGADVDGSFISLMAQNVVRRILSIVRQRGHGGMLIFVPLELKASGALDRWLRIRCPLAPTSSTKRFSELMFRVMSRMSIVGHTHGVKNVKWEDYQEFEDPVLAEIDEAFLELANLFADFMNVDGALVVSEQFEVMGFGAEVMGEEPVMAVHRALDLEANETVEERSDNLGTRHRSAYRFVMMVPSSVVAVISQDGSISFVANKDDRVVYWPYLP